MSGWSRTTKPSADTTKDANDIYGVDRKEIVVTKGPQHVGWVHRRTVGSRVLYETLVAMKTPPVEDNADDTVFPDTVITITAQPANKSTLAKSADTLFSVTATASPSATLAYQWQQSVNGGATYSNINPNGGVFTGVTTATLGVNSNMTDTTSTFNNAKFRCVITGVDTGVTATSAAGTLTVTVPVITVGTQPINASVTAPAGTSFTLAASSTPSVSLSYEWFVSTDAGVTFTTLAPDAGVYSGAETNTLTISDSTGLDGYQYKCEVSGTNDALTVASSTVTLTVA